MRNYRIDGLSVDISTLPEKEQIMILKTACSQNAKLLIQKEQKLAELESLSRKKKERRTERKKRKQENDTCTSQEQQTTAKEDIIILDVSYYVGLMNHYIAENGLNLEELAKLLPSSDIANFTYIMNHIILHFQKEAAYTTQFILENQATSTKEDLLSFREELTQIQDIIDLCKEHRDDAFVDLTVPVAEEKKGIVLFLHSMNGQNLFENDLKSFSSDYHEAIRILLQDLEDCSLRHSQQFTGNNLALKGYCELRNLSAYTRILYDKVGNNTYIVLGVAYKNTDNTKKLEELFMKRVDEYESQGGKKAIQERLAQEDSATYIEEAQTELERIKTKLKGDEKSERSYTKSTF